MKKLKVGLIGLGGVAEVHLDAYREVDEIDVVAGADLREERLKEVASKREIRGYTDYEQMLEKENLDVACVLTPAATHATIVRKVAERRVHVLCEKPMALILADARAMIESCEKGGVKLFYGSTYRFLPACRKAKEMIDQGLLGTPSLLMEVFVGGRGREHWHDLGPHHYPKGGPGGGGMGLVDHGIHLMDIFPWFTGSEVESVVGRGNYSGRPPATEYLTMTFKNGAVGQLVYNEATHPSDMPQEGLFSWGWSWDITGNLIPGGGWNDHPGSIRVHGDKGALRIFYYANKLFFFGESTREQIPLPHRPMPSNFALQIQSFARSIQQGEEPEVTGRHGLKALQVLLAAYESFETQKVVSIGSTK